MDFRAPSCTKRQFLLSVKKEKKEKNKREKNKTKKGKKGKKKKIIENKKRKEMLVFW